MTHAEHTIEDVVSSQAAFEQLVKARLPYAVRIALVRVLEEEVTTFMGAKPYERSEKRRDPRNGQYSRSLETTRGQIAELPAPRTRQGYQPQLFERYRRRRDELDRAMGEMCVKGVSTAQVGQVIESSR